MAIRSSPSQHLEPDELPMMSFPLQSEPNDHYVLQQVVGKQAKYQGKKFDYWHYVWMPKETA